MILSSASLEFYTSSAATTESLMLHANFDTPVVLRWTPSWLLFLPVRSVFFREMSYFKASFRFVILNIALQFVVFIIALSRNHVAQRCAAVRFNYWSSDLNITSDRASKDNTKGANTGANCQECDIGMAYEQRIGMAVVSTKPSNRVTS